jgi:hypothetical protein
LPVVVSNNGPTTLGSSTNEDRIVLARESDQRLWESPLSLDLFDAPLATSLGVRFRAYAYYATQFGRKPLSIAQISGTGLAAPTFA